MTNAPRSVSAPTFGDNMKGLDTFSTGYAAAEAKYMTELSATQRKLEAAEARIKDFERRCEAGYNKLDWLDANERVLELEDRIKASQEQETLTHVIVDWPDGKDFVVKLRVSLYAAPVIPPDVAELQRENEELTRKLKIALANECSTAERVKILQTGRAQGMENAATICNNWNKGNDLTANELASEIRKAIE